ncbi:MAG: gamma-glutamyl-gamma-aminobutyrate hydrolase family protein [Bdellovibrionales bacterium]
MRPLILTNAYRRPKATLRLYGVRTSAKQKVYATLDQVVDVINGPMGGSPILLPTIHDEDTVEALLPYVDGIFLPGSFTNIHPSNYGKEPKEEPQIFDSDHDRTDLFLIKKAREYGLPFLGVCRAMQAMNVAFGGTLHQDITKVCSENHMCSKPNMGTVESPRFMHKIYVAPKSALADLVGEPDILVNSIHEQAVDKLGDGLVAQGWTEDGLIEAVHWRGSPSFFFGLQWHPEYMPQNVVSQKIFAAYKQAVMEHFEERTRSLPSAERRCS